MGRTLPAAASSRYQSAAHKPEWKWGSGRREGKLLPLLKQERVAALACPQPTRAAQTRCRVIPAGDALTRQICARPGLCRAGASDRVVQGTGRSPNLLLLSLSFPFSWSGFFGVLGTPTPKCMEQPPFFCPHAICPAFPFPLCLPGTRWSVAGAELLALGCLHHQQLGLLLPGPGRWQAGQVASCKAARRKPP